MSPLLIGLLSLFATFDYTNGYGKGALNTHCVPMVPCHAIPQPGDPPANVTFSSSCYTPSVPVDVKIEARDGFRGIFLQMRRENKTLIARGSYKNVDKNKFKLITCRPGRDNALTNRHPHEIQEASFTWTPYPDNSENVELVYTFVESYYKIWIKAKKTLPRCSNQPTRSDY